MNFKTILYLMTFLLMVSIVFATEAVTQQNVYDKSVLILEMENTCILDNSTVQNTGTNIGPVANDTTNFVVGTASCDYSTDNAGGQTAFSNVGAYQELANYSIAWWWRYREVNFGGGLFTRTSGVTTALKNGDWLVVYPEDLDNIRFRHYVTTQMTSALTGCVIQSAETHFLAMCMVWNRTGTTGTMDFYINGTQCGQVDIGDLATNNNTIRISGYDGDPQTLGNIDSVWIENGSFDSELCVYHYNLGAGRVNELIDTIPTSTQPSINNTNPYPNEPIGLGFQFADDIFLSAIFVEGNDTSNGSFENFTSVNFTGTVTSSNFTPNITAISSEGFISFKATANDSIGQSNQSEKVNYTVDTVPAEITMGNITSEASSSDSLGQLVNLSDPFCEGLGCILPKINDTTFTGHFNSSKRANAMMLSNDQDFNFTDGLAYNALAIGSTTGQTHHILTIASDNATSIGLNNITISLDGNENLTSTLKFTVNITDNIPPAVNPSFPLDGSFFVVRINNTDIQFNFNATDNFDANFTCQQFINDVSIYSNSTYLNGTEGKVLSTVTSIGTNRWNVNCTDSFNNINGSGRDFEIKELDINFTLNQPENNTLIYTNIDIQLNFTINFTENIDTCYIIINNTINNTNNSLITSGNLFVMNHTNLTINNDWEWGVGCNVSTNGAQINSTDRFNLYVYNPPNVSFSVPTPINDSTVSNTSILINVSTKGHALNYTLDWNGINESVEFNNTLNVLINKTGLSELTTYIYRVYVNDSNGLVNNTEERIVNINLLGLTVVVTTGTELTFRPNVDRTRAVVANESLTWAGNATAIALDQDNIIGVILYNNGTFINQGGNATTIGNYTIDASARRITIFNSTTLYNGSNREWITDAFNLSYDYFTGTSFLNLQNISCRGQNETVGCINASVFATNDLNFSLLWNITNDPAPQKILEDFSVDARNWTVTQLRGNNTINLTILNASVTCGEIQSLNSSGLIEYRFNNTLETTYLNSSNVSVLINVSIDCPASQSYTRTLNGSQVNITGFDFLNFSWKGDNTSNRFNISVSDTDGTTVITESLSMDNKGLNFSGLDISTLGNVSLINISVTNISGTSGLSGFFVDNIRLTNITFKQSDRIRMKASCTNDYQNATLLPSGTLTQVCLLPNAVITNYIFLYQDINFTQKGITWEINYNASII